MGSTGYTGMSAQDAIALELRGTTVLARSGNWVMTRNGVGMVGLTHFLTKRYGSEVVVKATEITMGPYVTPPASIARKYVAAYDGDLEAAGGAYGAPVLRKALQPKTGPKAVPGYTVFTVEGVEYVWLGKYRARRARDGQVVRLPRNWRSRWLTSSAE